MNLNIKFELNKELDKEMAFVFTEGSDKIGGIDFSRGVTAVHPELEIIKGLDGSERKKAIEEYFDKYYENNKEELEIVLLKFKNDWDRIEDDFAIQLKKIFKNPTKPEGKWIGYLSIINCNPRFLNNKTFQVFYKHRNGSNSVAIHEILHFFFYDYAVLKFNNIFGNLDTNNGIFWTLAELFNDVIQDLPEFIELQDGIRISGYPSHAIHQGYLRKLWFDSPDIDIWIPKAYEYLLGSL